MITLIVATRNRHKFQEIQTILGPSFEYVLLEQLRDAPRLIEDGDSFAANATRKAVQLAKWLALRNLPVRGTWSTERLVLADDSGLEVDALNGAPGVHSARFAAQETGTDANSPDAENNARLLRLLRDVPIEKRTARFRCVLALTPVVAPDAVASSPVCSAEELEFRTELFEGVCEGQIEFAPRGQGGFGYDPLFVPAGHQESFAELGAAIKNEISHRARALAGLRRRLVKGSWQTGH